MDTADSQSKRWESHQSRDSSHHPGKDPGLAQCPVALNTPLSTVVLLLNSATSFLSRFGSGRDRIQEAFELMRIDRHLVFSCRKSFTLNVGNVLPVCGDALLL